LCDHGEVGFEEFFAAREAVWPTTVGELVPEGALLGGKPLWGLKPYERVPARRSSN
jgi:hypothetical protein